MLRQIKVIPLAAESLGVRSMCFSVATPDVRVLLDAGVSICPNRFGLPPHPSEFGAIMQCRRNIAEAAERSDVVTLSHYHFDHHTPSFEDWVCNWTAEDETAREIYEGKTVLVKNPKDKINFSQRRRGWLFQKTVGRYVESLKVADGRSFLFGETSIRFSKPVFHGAEDSMLGWVLLTAVEYQSEKIVFAPDVQGPISLNTLNWIIGEKPQLTIVGGPPLYLAGFRVAEEQVELGLRNLEKIVEAVPVTILEHHILRDENWRGKAANIFNKADENGHKVLTAAEYLGVENTFLEAVRKRLFAEHPPSKDFEKWMRENLQNKKKVKPPI